MTSKFRSIIKEDDKFEFVKNGFDETYFYDNYHVILNQEDRYIKGFINNVEVFNMRYPHRLSSPTKQEEESIMIEFKNNMYLLKGEVIQRKINNIWK